MRNNNVIGLIFANMHDDCLRELTALRALGSIPLGGRYRLIDFPLSSMVNAGISKVGIVTKNKYQSLMDHLGSGKFWDLSRKNEGISFLPLLGDDSFYEGRIASLLGIEDYLRNSREEHILMADCYMLGNIDYTPLLRQHIESGADITIGYQTGDAPEGIDSMLLDIAADGSVSDIRIGRECGCRHGIGLYMARKESLLQLVEEAVSRHLGYFERDVLQRRRDSLRIYGYEVPEYTAAITSLSRYFDANMALLRADIRRQLFTPSRPIYTKVRDCAPAIHGLHADVRDSLVADGASIDGRVSNSIIFRNVKIGRDTVVENSIVMQGAIILPQSQLRCVISDKNVVIRERSVLQGVESYPVFIRKNTVV